MSSLDAPGKFNHNIKTLIDLLKYILEGALEQGFAKISVNTITAIEQGINILPAKDIIEIFIVYSYKYWSQIRSHDLDHFMNAFDIFSMFNKDIVGHFKTLLKTPYVTEDDIKDIFGIFNGMIDNCQEYLKTAPKSVTGEYKIRGGMYTIQ